MCSVSHDSSIVVICVRGIALLTSTAKAFRFSIFSNKLIKVTGFVPEGISLFSALWASSADSLWGWADWEDGNKEGEGAEWGSCDVVEAHSWCLVSSWQRSRPSGLNVLLVSIINSCVVVHQFTIGMYKTVALHVHCTVCTVQLEHPFYCSQYDLHVANSTLKSCVGVCPKFSIIFYSTTLWSWSHLHRSTLSS